jgi:hypothetical protein
MALGYPQTSVAAVAATHQTAVVEPGLVGLGLRQTPAPVRGGQSDVGSLRMEREIVDPEVSVWWRLEAVQALLSFDNGAENPEEEVELLVREWPEAVGVLDDYHRSNLLDLLEADGDQGRTR